MKIPREPDFEQFLDVLWRRRRPKHLPFYEHKASPGFIAEQTGTAFDRMNRRDDGYWKIYVDFWLSLGFDCIPMEIRLNCPLGEKAGVTEGSESHAVIHSFEDYEKYPWPEENNPIDLEPFETVAGLLPPGAKIAGGVGRGPFEWISALMGTVGLSYALTDNPELVKTVFRRFGTLHSNAVKLLSSMDAIGALRQGDDLGFRTSTFLRPEVLRQHVFPIYRRMVEIAHQQGKPFILHSCGNLREIYDDLIDFCGFDAKHSFEDAILPVEKFKETYGKRITALGGLDVDVLCRGTETEIREYTRRHIELCFRDGFWALGTGNSLPDYLPVRNYRIVIDEGLKFHF